jgi:hypothetical protein
MLARGVSTLEGLVADLSPEVEPDGDPVPALCPRDPERHRLEKDARQKRKGAVRIGAEIAFHPRAPQRRAARGAQGRTEGTAGKRGRAGGRGRAKKKQAERQRRTLLYAACILASAVTALSGVEPRWLGLPWITVAGLAATAGLALYHRLRDWRRK